MIITIQKRQHSLHAPERIYGCSMAEAVSYPEKARVRYRAQKSRALSRGIQWEFNIYTWWAKWECAGGFYLAGPKGSDLCMARFGDSGPYSPSNVYICTRSENTKDWNLAGRPNRKTR
jgi:hypothetical protein